MSRLAGSPLVVAVWDRSRDALVTSGVPRSELDAMAGVSLYRDGLRVLPYGEPGNDWLFLDQERIQAPAERIGNNQVIGLVEVDQSTNLLLRHKTNREGLIENDAFLDLRTLVRAVEVKPERSAARSALWNFVTDPPQQVITTAPLALGVVGVTTDVFEVAATVHLHHRTELVVSPLEHVRRRDLLERRISWTPKGDREIELGLAKRTLKSPQ